MISALAELIHTNKEALLVAWRAKVRELPSAKHLDVPTLNDHIPGLLDELVLAFEERTEETIADIVHEGTPTEHGEQRVEDGFDIIEVVAEYSMLRMCIHDLAEANGLVLAASTHHILNRVVDGAIGVAVERFATQRALDVQREREQYLAFVAHDLRTPLNAIALTAEALDLMAPLEEGTEDAADRAVLATSLHRNVGQLKQLVAKVLDENSTMRTEVGASLHARMFDLWPLVEGLVHGLQPVAGTDSTHLINEVPVGQRVYADAELLERIFQNLIGNALHYTPRGQVSIGARELPGKNEIECWVSDTGSGIPPDRLQSIFAKGERDPDRKDSHGLGLTIVRTFVEAHGGSVSAESAEGEGTTIRFVLPLQRKG